MSPPRIKTTLVGSYPLPDWLVSNPSQQALDDAVRLVINIQETSDIDVVCDGEMYRFDINHPETNGMIEYFLKPMGGIRNAMSFDEINEYRKSSGMKFRRRPPGIVEAPITSGTLDLPSACQQAEALASRPLKFTLTGPHMLAKTLIDKFYGNIKDLTDALASVLAEQVSHLNAQIIQLDEANLPGNPDEWEWAAAAINKVLDAVPTIPAVHLCFGNYGGQTIQSGNWKNLIKYLNALHVDHIIMENARRPEGELEAFKGLRSEIGMGLGVIDIKCNQIETPDQVAHALERAEKILGRGKIKYIHPDCGFWMLKRNIADGKIDVLAKGRDLYEGRA